MGTSDRETEVQDPTALCMNCLGPKKWGAGAMRPCHQSSLSTRGRELGALSQLVLLQVREVRPRAGTHLVTWERFHGSSQGL